MSGRAQYAISAICVFSVVLILMPGGPMPDGKLISMSILFGCMMLIGALSPEPKD